MRSAAAAAQVPIIPTIPTAKPGHGPATTTILRVAVGHGGQEAQLLSGPVLRSTQKRSGTFARGLTLGPARAWCGVLVSSIELGGILRFRRQRPSESFGRPVRLNSAPCWSAFNRR